MNSFNFNTDNSRFRPSKEVREIKFRGQSPYYPYKTWVVGGYFYIDDDTNDPFRTYPLRETHRIVSYYSGDWNLGGWNYNEVYSQTIQQYINMTDFNHVDIYEGDIVRIYYGISYDEDGTITVSDEYDERLVNYKDGTFRFGDEPIYEFEPKETFQIYVIGNVFDTPEHPLAVEYHINRLCNTDGVSATLSDDICLALLDFVKNITSLPLLQASSSYQHKENRVCVTFEVNGTKFTVFESLDYDVDNDIKRYGAKQYNYTGIIEEWHSDNLNEVVNNIVNRTT